MAAETKLTIAAGTTGTQQAATELQKVADAQGQVGAKVDASAKMMEAARPAAEALAEAQTKLAALRAERGTALADGKSVGEVMNLNDAIGEQERRVSSLGGEQAALNATHRDWIAVLRGISPELGNFVQETLHAVKVTQELGDKKTLLSSLGAVAVPVFIAIAFALRNMADEFAVATAAIRDQAKALDELALKGRERQQSIEDTRAASKLPIFTPDEARVAHETAGRIGEQFPFIDEGAVNRAVAFTGGAAGEVGGGAFGLEQIARLARLIQLGPESLKLTEQMSPAAVQREITSELERHRGRLDEEFASQASQSAERAARTPVEVAQMGGSTLGLRERIARRAPEGMNIDHLVELAQNLQGPEELESFSRKMEMAISGESPTMFLARLAFKGAGLLGIDAGKLSPRATATETDLAVLRGTFAEMAAELRRIASPTRIDARQYNPKNYGPDARSQRGRTHNGDSRVKEIEGWGSEG